MAKKSQRTVAPKKRKASKGMPKAGASGKYLGHYGWMPDVPDLTTILTAHVRSWQDRGDVGTVIFASWPPDSDLRVASAPSSS